MILLKILRFNKKDYIGLLIDNNMTIQDLQLYKIA